MKHIAHLKWSDGQEEIQEVRELSPEILIPVYEPYRFSYSFYTPVQVTTVKRFRRTKSLKLTAGVQRGYYEQIVEEKDSMTTYRPGIPGIWIGSGGRETPIEDLESLYLANIIRKLEREGKTDHPRYDELLEEAANRTLNLSPRPSEPYKKYGKAKLPPVKVKTPEYYPDEDIPF